MVVFGIPLLEAVRCREKNFKGSEERANILAMLAFCLKSGRAGEVIVANSNAVVLQTCDEGRAMYNCAMQLSLIYEKDKSLKIKGRRELTPIHPLSAAAVVLSV